MSSIDALVRHYDRLFGATPSWSREEAGVSVARYTPKAGVLLEPTSEIFITAGMSDRPMKVPDAKVPARVELLIACPGNWSAVYATEIEDFFVVDTLRTTARYPFERDTFLGASHTIPAGRPLAPATEMAGWVLTAPLVLKNAQPIALAAGNVHLLLMTPLYPLELALARSNGTAALMGRLFSIVETVGLDWSFFLRPQRPDTVGGTTIVAG